MSRIRDLAKILTASTDMATDAEVAASYAPLSNPTFTAIGGSEGGQINLAAAPSNTTLSGNINLDVYQNRVRLFEGGGNNRGAYVDLTTLSNGVGSELIASAPQSGNTGKYLVTNGTSASWQELNVAGKNAVINGGFDIWQRGTSFTNPGSTYTVDRWIGYWSANGTVTQETTNVPSGCRYALRMTATANGAGNNFYQLIETNNTIPLAGKTVTFSAYVAGTNGKTPVIGIDTSTVVDDSLFGSWTGLATSSPVTTSSTYQRVTVTATIPSNAKSLRVHLDSYPVNNTDFLLWSGVQLELGSVATPFSRAGGNIQGELAACQRYYYRNSNPSKSYAAMGTLGVTNTNTNFELFVPVPVTMRIPPTSVEYSNLRVWDYNNSLTVTAATLSESTATMQQVAFTVSGAVAGRVAILQGNNNSAAYLGFSAEL